MQTTGKWMSRVVIAALVFFGASLSLRVEPRQPLEVLPTLRVDLATLAPIYAASNQWDGVRGVADFLKNVTTSVDTIIVALTRSGALNGTQVITATQGNFKFKLNPAFNTSVASTAFPGGKTYTVSFEVWRTSDNTKYLELFFDSASTRNEVLAIWQPNVFDTTVSQSGSNKMECAMTGGAVDGYMVCSWNGPIEASGIMNAGRFKVDSVSSDGTVRVKGAAKLQVASDICAGGNQDYYALAFISKSVTPFYSTGRWGLNDNAIAATACGAANGTNNAYFNITSNPNATDSTKYFVQDGVTTDLDANYPTVAATNALFGEMGGTDSDGVAITTAALTALSVTFRQPTSPGF